MPRTQTEWEQCFQSYLGAEVAVTTANVAGGEIREAYSLLSNSKACSGLPS